MTLLKSFKAGYSRPQAYGKILCNHFRHLNLEINRTNYEVKINTQLTQKLISMREQFIPTLVRTVTSLFYHSMDQYPT